MTIDYSKLISLDEENLIEPRDIFMALPKKEKKYEYPRDVQTEVWKQWFEKRNEKNVIIKMNTGSGKTLVGLTILQSCLKEGKGPAIYVVPDNYLVNQVCKEAKELGIRVASNSEDAPYVRVVIVSFRLVYVIILELSVKYFNGREKLLYSRIFLAEYS